MSSLRHEHISSLGDILEAVIEAGIFWAKYPTLDVQRLKRPYSACNLLSNPKVLSPGLESIFAKSSPQRPARFWMYSAPNMVAISAQSVRMPKGEMDGADGGVVSDGGGGDAEVRAVFRGEVVLEMLLADLGELFVGVAAEDGEHCDGFLVLN